MEFESDNVRLHYEIHGPATGTPIVLVHGFASSYRLNWVGTRWEETLTQAGFKVIGLDCRGHGASDKPVEPAAYSVSIMAADVVRLLDHVGVERANFLGFSMGARIGLGVVLASPFRMERAVLGGFGIGGATKDADRIADALLAGPQRGDRVSETFYRFAAAQPANNLRALAACMRGLRAEFSEAALAAVRTPILLVIGDRDDIAGDAERLTELVPTARLVTVSGRDHLGLVPAREFKRVALDFLATD